MILPHLQAEAEAAIRDRWPNKGPCLVPHKSAATKDSTWLTCHENDFCLCNMREVIEIVFTRLCEMSGSFSTFNPGRGNYSVNTLERMVEERNEALIVNQAALLKAREENEQIMSLDYWHERYKAERARCELFKNALTEISKLKNSDFAGQYSIMAAKIARQALSGEG